MGRGLLKVIFLSLLLFLFSPFFILYFVSVKTFSPALPLWGVIDSIIYFTVLQSFLSLIITLFFGFVGALGILKLRNKMILNTVEILAVLPQFLPTLFIVFSLLPLLDRVEYFFGKLGSIIFVHSFINIGLTAIVFARIIRYKVTALSSLALIEGSGFILFWRATLPYLKKEISILALFLFLIFFSSFSIPLLLGNVPTLEIYIFDQIYLYNNWNIALSLSLIQIIGFYLISFVFHVFNSERSTFFERQYDSFQGFTLRGGWLVFLLILLIIVLGSFNGFIQGVEELLSSMQELNLIQIILFSVALSLSVGLMVGGLLIMSLFLLPDKKLHHILMAYISPSVVVTGFALVLLLKTQGDIIFSFFKLVLGLSFVLWPMGYRLLGAEYIESIKKQHRTSQSMGATHSQIFKWVVFPQVFPMLGLVMGLSALWAMGDFALSQIILPLDLSLPLLIKTLLSSYRFELSSVLVWVLLFLGVGAFLVFFKGSQCLARQINNQLFLNEYKR